MATTYEDYVTFWDSAPSTALSRARSHLQALMEAKRPRIGDQGTSHDSSTLDADIDRTRKDIDSLRILVSRAGVPQMVPVRRVY